MSIWPRSLWLALLLGSGLACKSSPPGPDDGGMGTGIDPDGGSTTEQATAESGPPPEEAETESDWGECFGPGDYSTCAGACAAEGRLCRAEGCGDGFTAKGYATPNCIATTDESVVGCLEEIPFIATGMECCCL